jgi:branched-chain amino acid transport system permease protein
MLNYLLSFLINYSFIMVIGMLAVFILTGLTGMFSMGQAAFMAVGGYTAALMSRFFKTNIWINIPISILVGMFFGFLIALPVIKLRRDYIAIVTLLFGQAVVAFLNNSTDITGGALGLSGIPRQTNHVIISVFLILAIYMVNHFKKSRFGRQCIAVKSCTGDVCPNFHRFMHALFDA